MTTLEQIQQDLQCLSEAEQKLLYDFIQLLKKNHALPSLATSMMRPSFLEEASEFVGCLEGGTGDLATNKAHMQGFGQ
jgi:hypothetical protein